MMSGKSLAMMPWFPRDFIAATRHLALAERGAYRELLDYQWEMGVLPKDEKRLARLLAITPDEFAEIWPSIRDKFEDTENGISNKRLEEHRKKAVEQRDKRINGAVKTNAKRYGERDAMRDAKRLDIESPPTPSPSPSQIKKKSKNPHTPSRGVQQVFDHWRIEWQHPDSALDDKRQRRIEARLARFTPEQLCNAISGFRHSDWHTGRDPKGGGKIYDKIETLLRDDSQVEEGIRLFTHPPRPPPEKRVLSAVERVELANGLRRNDERVVAEQDGSSWGDLEDLGGDVRSEVYSGLRRIGA